ncbi:cytochrome o ubiquinol oxidase subunit III [Ralstonia pseudosolanacearum]|uniref:Cytochrome bo(3) ubiquinol oxidase subunit 3 n=1 Tax=Ralstonia nicotianae (strain ATCC BAA-1114 / GMI1000) TaxID=267608 RepID=Q8XYA2_RALN1|nr:cytochrome o ubiquinol oxidase subunit III [Ralstonia pseudosolanacearum]AST27431.1 cytochrome o ubiquinol oxidase subunit III [Ralstonia pseudosolanacearum]MDC6286639.1 cytochrome o ubiquinol oxidase subunit III [Ralstonia pseudosolanacearum]CAD15562.1 probable transmembrane cytochrome o ubiquinol oxidase (subunit III) oxidoreductase protein [Ralstonia pseudosolanacearum GMI1000]
MTHTLSPTLDPTAPEAAHPHPHHDTGFNTTLGFWLYLMSDCLIFAVLFATFGVLSGSTAGGPGGRQLFELPFVLAETMLLLVSSYTFGIALLKQDADAAPRMVRWLGVTFLLGALFVGMELYEFSHLLHEGAGPGVSAYLSAFFTLVGTHGLHVTAGLLWLAVMMHQVRHFGLDGVVRRRLACLSLFWHFLDLVWICVFTFVYLREFA